MCVVCYMMFVGFLICCVLVVTYCVFGVCLSDVVWLSVVSRLLGEC